MDTEMYRMAEKYRSFHKESDIEFNGSSHGYTLSAVLLTGFIATAFFPGCDRMDTATKDQTHEGAMLKKVVRDFLDFSTGRPSGYEPVKDELSILNIKEMNMPTRDRVLVDLAVPLTIPERRIRTLAVKRAFAIMSEKNADVVKVRLWPKGFEHLGGILAEAMVSKDDGGWDGKSQETKFRFIPHNRPWKQLTPEELEILSAMDTLYETGLKRGLTPEKARKAALISASTKLNRDKKYLQRLMDKATRFFYHPGDTP